MKCPKCGAQLLSGMTVCPKCQHEEIARAEAAEAERRAKAEAEEAERRAKAEAEETERRVKAEAEEIERLRKWEYAKSEAEKAEFVSQKIEKLKAEGRDGYYEYKVAQIPLRSDITPVQATIDSFSLNGWKIESYNPSASGGSVMILFSKYNKF